MTLNQLQTVTHNIDHVTICKQSDWFVTLAAIWAWLVNHRPGVREGPGVKVQRANRLFSYIKC